jgi:hypothetical protein
MKAESGGRLVGALHMRSPAPGWGFVIEKIQSLD